MRRVSKTPRFNEGLSKSKYFLSLLFIIVIAEAILLLYKNPIRLNLSGHKSTMQIKTLDAYADEVYQRCVQIQDYQTCYDKEIPKLMDYISMEDAFKVTSIVQEKDKRFTYCHVLGHNLSAREVDKDPSKWKELVSRCPSGMCSNGCLHGGFQEKFRSESLTDKQVEDIKPNLKSLCEERGNWHPTRLEQASCYHALGHLTMYLTNADIKKSITLCEEIALKVDGRDFRQLCFDGVFMQIFQPLEPEDFALIKGKEVNKDKVVAFCDKYPDKRKASCWSESWPLFREELVSDPKNLVWFCSQAPTGFGDRCYSASIYVLTAQMQFDSNKIGNYCGGLPSDKQGLCFANAASRMIETDYRNIQKSTSLCLNSKTEENKNRCLNELLFYSTYNFHPGSKEFLELCNGLPEPWKAKCLNKSKVAEK